MSEYYMDQSFLVIPHFSTETALIRLKERAPFYAPRASQVFQEALQQATLESLKTQVQYAPIYHAFAKGEYSWTETSYQNAGNPLIGNFTIGVDHIKRSTQNLNLTINKSAAHGYYLLHLDSYQADDGNVLRPISNEKANALPLLYPMLSSNLMVKELAAQAKQAHKGDFDISALEVLLALVPVACFQFDFMGQTYKWFVNLYDGKIDLSDVDVAPEIETTFQKCKKVHRVSTIAKFTACAVLILDLILALVKISNDTFSGITDIPSFTIFWILFSAIPALLIFLPFKKQRAAWEDLTDEYSYSDRLITHSGKLRFKAMLYLVLDILQIVVPSAFAICMSLICLL